MTTLTWYLSDQAGAGETEWLLTDTVEGTAATVDISVNSDVFEPLAFWLRSNAQLDEPAQPFTIDASVEVTSITGDVEIEFQILAVDTTNAYEFGTPLLVTTTGVHTFSATDSVPSINHTELQLRVSMRRTAGHGGVDASIGVNRQDAWLTYTLSVPGGSESTVSVTAEAGGEVTQPSGGSESAVNVEAGRPLANTTWGLGGVGDGFLNDACASPTSLSSRVDNDPGSGSFILLDPTDSQGQINVLNIDEPYGNYWQLQPDNVAPALMAGTFTPEGTVTLGLEFDSGGLPPSGSTEISWEIWLFDPDDCSSLGMLVRDPNWYDPTALGWAGQLITLTAQAEPSFDVGRSDVVPYVIVIGVALNGDAFDIPLTRTPNDFFRIGESLVGPPSGGAESPVTVTPEASATSARSGGAETSVSVTAEGSSTFEILGGSEAPVSVQPEGAASKATSAGAEASVTVAAEGDGSGSGASGGAEAPVSVADEGAGEKVISTGAESGITATAEGGATKSSESGAESSVTATAEGSGEADIPPSGGLVYGPWEQTVTIGAVSNAFVRDAAIRWNTRGRVDQASFTVEDMPQMAASFDACQFGTSVTIIQTDGVTTVRFDGTIVSAQDERGTNWTQRKVECHSQEEQAKWVRFQHQWKSARADTIVQQAWQTYGTAVTTSLDIGSNSDRFDLTSSWDTLFDLMEKVCQRTAWAWRIDQGTLRFFDPLSEESPSYNQANADVEADTLRVKRDTRQIVNSIRAPVWIYRTQRKTVKALAAEDCIKQVRALEMLPPNGWELVGEPRIVEDFAPEDFEREARLTDDGWIEFDPPLIPEEQAEPGSLFLQLYAEVIVEVTHRRKVWLVMESAASIAEYGRREGQPLNDDGGQTVAEGEQLLTEYLARHAFPTIEVSGSALKFGYRRDSIANVSLIDPPLAAPLYVTSVQHTTNGNELQVQLEFASPDTVLDSGAEQRPTTSDVDVIHELSRRIIQLERRDAHPLGVLGITTAEVGPLSPADGTQDGSGWGEKTSASAGDTESFAEGSGWGESVVAFVQ